MRTSVYLKLSVLTILNLISFHSVSREIKKSEPSFVHRTVDGKILITASCNTVKDRVAEIKQWTIQVTNAECSEPKQVVDSDGRCTFDITDCVPDHVRKFHGLTGTNAGPNCWNTALVMAQILPFMRETRDDEWSFYMNSPLCKAVPDSEPLKAGDIGSLEARTKKHTLQVHGFIHISDTLVYAKEGIGVRTPFALQTYSKMNQMYPFNKMNGECESDCAPQSLERFYDPKVLDSIPNYLKTTEVCLDAGSGKRAEVENACFNLSEFLAKNKAKCETDCSPAKVYYYRCDSFENYFSKLDKSEQGNYEKFEKMAETIECAMQPSFLHGTVLTPEAKSSIAGAYGAILKYLDQELQRTPITDVNKILLSRLALRVKVLLDPAEFLTNNKIKKLLKPNEE